MGIESVGKMKFQVEIRRVLEILSAEIYDSPYAILRENVQNAYDAILMRHAQDEQWPIDQGVIEITMNANELTIKDNGLGMTEEVLRENFWKAGSSGKRTELARRAGVVGTFGIGAMANFGVCTRLEVRTRSLGSPMTLTSSVELDQISLTEDCIDFFSSYDDGESGTTVKASLSPGQPIVLSEAIGYLRPFVQYLPVRLLVNQELLGQHDYRDDYIYRTPNTLVTSSQINDNNNFSGDLSLHIDGNGNVSVEVTNMRVQHQAVTGEIVLRQGVNHIMGLRNGFGLAGIPVGQFYNFGGIVNLSILQPTAGREALSRDSIEMVNRMVTLIELAASEALSKTQLADNNPAFLGFINSNNRLDLAGNVNIQVEPHSQKYALSTLEGVSKSKQLYYYTGVDNSIIRTFASDSTGIVIVSQSNPRRRIQQAYLQRLAIQQIPDHAQIIRKYERTELARPEVGLTIRMISVLQDDYMLNDVEVVFADISHGVQVLAQQEGNRLHIYLSRDSAILKPVLECYSTAYEAFGAFVKDFVRVHLYQRIANFVPSATKQGADALHKILMKRKELYHYEVDDIGKMESLLTDLMSGTRSFADILRDSKQIVSSQTVTVNSNQVGTVESELPDIISTPVIHPESNVQEVPQSHNPGPSILRLDSETSMKILTVGSNINNLNNFRMFLSLSDKLFNTERDFFIAPHSTKVLWGSHRVVYIFTHASARLTLYYDIELNEPVQGNLTGGDNYPTTTIVTKNRIFVPIPNPLIPSFQLDTDKKEFYVRFDTITQ